MKIYLPVAVALGVFGLQPLSAQFASFSENFGVPGAAVRTTEDTTNHPIGYQTPYTFFGTAGTNLPNQAVAIANNLSAFAPAWRSFGDHTTGSGYMLGVNGSTQASGNGPAFYSTTIANVSPGTSLVFSFWAQNALNLGGVANNPATVVLGYSVNGGAFSFVTPSNALVNYNVWTQLSATIPASAIVATSSVMFALFDTSGVASGNGFAVDDIGIAVPETGTVFAGIAALLLVGWTVRSRTSAVRPGVGANGPVAV